MVKVTQLNVDDNGARRRIHLREISGDGDAPVDTVGSELRAARQRRGEDLATVSRALKIRKDHLEAVEESRLEKLPGKTYAIGFVRSYAGYLGLDTPDLVDRYKAEIAERSDGHTPTIPPMPDEPRRLPQGWRIVAGVVVLTVGYGVYHLLFGGQTQQPVPPPPSIAAPGAAVPEPIMPQAAAPAAQPAPGPAETKAAQQSTPAPASNHAAARAATQSSATPSPALSGTAAPPAPAAGGTVYGQQNLNPRVILKAQGDTHVTVKGANGMVYINRTLKAGDSYRLPNLVGLSLWTTNAGALEVDLDGQKMGVMGSESQSLADLPMDPQAIVDRYSH